MRMLYIIGEPGVGKSSLMRALTSTLRWTPVDQPVPHRALGLLGREQGWHAAEIGGWRPDFPGTDALAMNVQPKVLRWLEGAPYPLVIAEGDRLGNGKFFDAVLGMGVELAIVHLWAPEPIAAARRRQRGSDQNAAWVQGRRTKAAGLAARYSVLPVEARMPPMMLAEQLRALPGLVGSMCRQLQEGRDGKRTAVLDVSQPDGDGTSAELSVGEHGSAADPDDSAAHPDAEPVTAAAGSAPDATGDPGAD